MEDPKLLFAAEATTSPCSVSMVSSLVGSDRLRKGNLMVVACANEGQGGRWRDGSVPNGDGILKVSSDRVVNSQNGRARQGRAEVNAE